MITGWMREIAKVAILIVTDGSCALPDGVLLNRYWDDKATPRPEAYREDVELAEEAFEKHNVSRESIYRHIRAAAESGWDFSTRWFDDENDFSTIQTTDIIPVDLNCLMYHLEKTMAEAYLLNEEFELYQDFELRAKKRCEAIDTYFWDGTPELLYGLQFCQKRAVQSSNTGGGISFVFQTGRKTAITLCEGLYSS